MIKKWLRFSVWLVFPGLGVEGEFLGLEVGGGLIFVFEYFSILIL